MNFHPLTQLQETNLRLIAEGQTPIVNEPAPMTTRDCLQVLADLERWFRNAGSDGAADEVYGVACGIASEHKAELS